MDPVFSKVLFLDIDGVMNSGESARIHKSFDVLDPIAIKFLQHLEKNDVTICVSSTWRKFKNRFQLSEILMINVKIVTPIIDTKRGYEIQKVIDNFKIPTYCIVDDDSDMLDHQLQFFVKTDFQKGIQKSYMDKICNILKVPLFFDA
jgi:hypothetical protein